MEWPVQASRVHPRQIRGALSPRRDGERNQVAELVDPMPTRKATQRAISAPVPQTDTGRWGENPKARERNLVKELGKMIP